MDLKETVLEDTDWTHLPQNKGETLEEQLFGTPEQNVLRREFEHKRKDEKVEWRRCIMTSFMICTLDKIILRRSNQGE
jgi:hypothetical protein